MFQENTIDSKKIMNQLEFPVSLWKINNPVDRKEVDIKLNKEKAGTLIFEVQAFAPFCEHSKPSKNTRINRKLAGESKLTIKLLMIGGDHIIGQTSLMIRYTDNFYSGDSSTIGMYFRTKKNQC